MGNHDRISSKLSHHLWRQRFVVFCTSRCNFQCPHCLRQNFDNKKNVKIDLSLDLFKQCLMEFEKINYGHVSFTGGEPILHPQFEELIKSTTEKNYSFNVVSNGWLYLDYFSILEKYRSYLTIINFSLDGSTAEVHDKIRNKPGSFERVIKAVKFYKENGFKVGVQTCFSQINLPQAENIYKLLASFGVDRWAIMGVDNIIRDKDADYSLSDRDRMFLLRDLPALNLKREIPNLSLCASVHCHGSPVIPFCSNLHSFEPAINPDGSMLFCCDIYKECFNRPNIKSQGFWPVFKINLAVVEKLKLQRLKDITDGNFFDGFSACNYCNTYIEEILEDLNELRINNIGPERH